MSNELTLIAELRSDEGKGASRRLRRLEDKVPAIIYGGTKKPVSISIQHKDFIKQLENEEFYSQVVELVVNGKAENVLLKALQRHPARPVLMHADFMRVSKTKKLQTSVPLHFINEEVCVGVKQQGGTILHTATQLEISCLAANLPAFIEVDLAAVEAGQTLHISDLALPKGVTSVALALGSDHDLPLVSVNKKRGGGEEAAEGETEAAAE